MIIRIFVSRSDTYHSIDVDTDSLKSLPSYGTLDFKPSLFIDDLISDLIDKN